MNQIIESKLSGVPFDKFLVEIQVQLDDKKVQLDVTDEAREWLAENGYDEKMGARPMQRLIQNSIKKELAEDILFGKLANGGGLVRVRVGDDGLILEIEEPEKAPAWFYSLKVMRPLERSYGDSSTFTESPVKIFM